ncbi:Aste57867_9113 [Aphanomyces stellatus]|uniref:Aste57867_9113 protein n=1 Tax=Aphanomyces stellatus TaxID=120398 RepID=A0A485KM13_9STRA|nr:hypothetical protein As57867_009077 [Aphanomyces stellatus]VFT85997.1 Aste57867_9113 [Aphanomyces stellatus]
MTNEPTATTTPDAPDLLNDHLPEAASILPVDNGPTFEAIDVTVGATATPDLASSSTQSSEPHPPDVPPPTDSIESIREWRHRPAAARLRAVRARVAVVSGKGVSPPPPPLDCLCRSETSNGIFEGHHGVDATCGVTTTAVGKSIAMQSFDIDHTFGIVQDGSDFIYEGELDVNIPHGYGVGTVGEVRFIGVWVAGRPCGLGACTRGRDTTRGWFAGPSAVVALEPGQAIPALTLPLPMPRDQPLSGLYVLCRRLETARLSRFRRVLDTWMSAVCAEVVAVALQARTVAFVAWANACTAQQAAMRHEGLQLHSRETDDGLMVRVKALVASEAAVREKNALRQKRLQYAELTHTTTVACLGIERRSTELLQAELDLVEAELADAKATERRCRAMQEEYADIRARIEQGKVKLNAMKQTRRHDAMAAGSTAAVMMRKPSMVPMPRRRSSVKVYVGDAPKKDDTIAYVCGVEGCDCHVPKDVFRPEGDFVDDGT